MDLEQTFKIVHGYVRADLSPSTAMARIIDACEALRPHDDWARFRDLPYNEMSDLEDWICLVLSTEPPGALIAGLWFGLFNPVYDKQTVADIYVCGSNRFEPDSEDNDWAVGPDWWPENRYAHSAILTTIYQIAYDENGLENDAEYPLCLAYGALATKHLLSIYGRNFLHSATKTVGVATGFDSGDFILLGNLTDDGLKNL